MLTEAEEAYALKQARIATAQLIRRHPGLYLFDEVYSEALYGIAMALARYDPTKAQWRTYMTQCITWQLQEWRRVQAKQHARRLAIEGTDGEEAEDTVEDWTDRGAWEQATEARLDLDALLPHLLPKQRDLVKAVYLVGTTQAEMAERLGRAPESICSSLVKAVRRMRAVATPT